MRHSPENEKYHAAHYSARKYAQKYEIGHISEHQNGAGKEHEYHVLRYVVRHCGNDGNRRYGNSGIDKIQYSTAEKLPAYIAPSTVRTATIMNASTGEYITRAANENTFAIPILAPGITSGGNRLSIINAIRLNPVNMASTAIFFAALITVKLYTKLYNK